MKNNNIPYLIRNKTPTLIVLSAGVIALMLTSSLLFSQALQPVQAQTPITFRTPTPAVAQPYPTTTLTFDAQGTLSSDSTEAMITKGTFQVTDTGSGQTLYNGSIKSGGFTNSTDGGNINAFGDLDYPAGGGTFGISTSCSASTNNDIQLGLPDYSNNVFQGVVECSVGEVNAIAQPSSSSSSMTGIKQDSDRDGVPDSSDKCAHNSNPKCFKEGDTSNTTTTTNTTSTTHEQEQPSSSNNRTGNQTR